MTVNEFVPLVGIILAASYASYGLEGLGGLHPAVRRGLQVTLGLAAAVYLSHALRLF